MPDIISINGLDVKLGEHKSFTMNVAKLPTHTNIDLSVQVFRAKKMVRYFCLPVAYMVMKPMA